MALTFFFQLFVAFSELFELQLHKEFEPSKDGLPCHAKKNPSMTAVKNPMVHEPQTQFSSAISLGL